MTTKDDLEIPEFLRRVPNSPVVEQKVSIEEDVAEKEVQAPVTPLEPLPDTMQADITKDTADDVSSAMEVLEAGGYVFAFYPTSKDDMHSYYQRLNELIKAGNEIVVKANIKGVKPKAFQILSSSLREEHQWKTLIRWSKVYAAGNFPEATAEEIGIIVAEGRKFKESVYQEILTSVGSVINKKQIPANYCKAILAWISQEITEEKRDVIFENNKCLFRWVFAVSDSFVVFSRILEEYIPPVRDSLSEGEEFVGTPEQVQDVVAKVPTKAEEPEQKEPEPVSNPENIKKQARAILKANTNNEKKFKTNIELEREQKVDVKIINKKPVMKTEEELITPKKRGRPIVETGGAWHGKSLRKMSKTVAARKLLLSKGILYKSVNEFRDFCRSKNVHLTEVSAIAMQSQTKVVARILYEGNFITLENYKILTGLNDIRPVFKDGREEE